MREWESPQLQALALEIKLQWHRRAATTRRMVQAAPTTFVNMARKAMAQPLTPARSTTPLPLQQQPAEEKSSSLPVLMRAIRSISRFSCLYIGNQGHPPLRPPRHGRPKKTVTTPPSRK